MEDFFRKVLEHFGEMDPKNEIVSNCSHSSSLNRQPHELINQGALVFMMQAGFAMLCAGSVRQKNVKNIMLKNLLDACGGAIGFFAIGYAFAYGGEETFIGTDYFFLANFPREDYHNWFFQFAFAATAATIVAGTVAERCKMQAYLCYSVFLTGFVYPVIVRSIWSSAGFLTAFRDDPFRGVGVIDFAGSGVVHMTGKLSTKIILYLLITILTVIHI